MHNILQTIFTFLLSFPLIYFSVNIILTKSTTTFFFETIYLLFGIPKTSVTEILIIIMTTFLSTSLVSLLSYKLFPLINSKLLQNAITITTIVLLIYLIIIILENFFGYT